MLRGEFGYNATDVAIGHLRQLTKWIMILSYLCVICFRFSILVALD